jgi:hypothetical protein
LFPAPACPTPCRTSWLHSLIPTWRFARHHL